MLISESSRFKLHLTLNLDAYTHKTFHIPSLPAGKTVVDVLADYYRYMLQCTREYITESCPNGETTWVGFGRHIEFVLSHPNGWGGAQQNRMRQAAVLAGLITNTVHGHERIHFVSEGEASFHFCIKHGLMEQVQAVCSIHL